MRTLADLRQGESARLVRLMVGDDEANSVMEAGFIPGTVVKMLQSAPGGGPRIYRVDGAEIAIRVELAAAFLVEETA